MSKGLEALSKHIQNNAERELINSNAEFNATNLTEVINLIYRDKNIQEVIKELKALEIIKTKRVDVEWFCQALKIQSCKPIEYYNRNDIDTDLTQDEFDILKEVLSDD